MTMRYVDFPLGLLKPGIERRSLTTTLRKMKHPYHVMCHTEFIKDDIAPVGTSIIDIDNLIGFLSM